MLNAIGMRTIKTAIAVSIAVFVSQLLKLEFPYFVAMTAIISMDKTALNSLHMWKNRTFGTLIGAILGLSFSLIATNSALLCGLAMIILCFLLIKLKMNAAIPISGFVMIAIMLNTQTDPALYAFHRTIDTFIGGAISLIVNIAIFPYYQTKRIDDELDALWDFTHQLIEDIKKDEIDDTKIKQLHHFIHKYKNEFKIYTEEVFFKNRDKLALKGQKHIEMLYLIYIQLMASDKLKESNSDIYQFHINNALNIYDDYLESL